MPTNALDQLQDLARQNTALRHALEAAADPASLQTIAGQQGLRLSQAEIEQWFNTQAALAAAALSADELDALSQGLSDPDRDTATLSEERLTGVVGGEAVMIQEIDGGGEAC